MAILSLLDGITTDVFSDACALRMRVSMSATGSLMLMHSLRLPAGLDDARNLAAQRDVAQLVARQTELAEHAARAAGEGTAVAQPDRTRVAWQLLQPQASGIAIL